jgi:hypothetical protein
MGGFEVQEQHTTWKHMEKTKLIFYKNNDTYTPVRNWL